MAKSNEAKNEVALFGAKTALPTEAAKDAGMGNENVSAADVGIPQIKLLQALSPQCQTVEGAKAGLFFNTQTNELMDAVYFISLTFVRTFTVWKDQNLGGGKMGEFDTNEAAVAARAQLPGNEADYDVQETCAHYVLLLDPASNSLIGPAVMYMDRSKLSAHRDLNALILRNSPQNESRLAMAYKFAPKSVTNKKSQQYFVIDVQNATGTAERATVSNDVYVTARDSLNGLRASMGIAANDEATDTAAA
jgi:hypothetical protein